MKDLRIPSEVLSESVKSENVLDALSGLRLSFSIETLDSDVLPTIFSSRIKFISFVGSRNNLLNPVYAPVALTVAVAPVVIPVTVSPTVNSEVYPSIELKYIQRVSRKS